MKQLFYNKKRNCYFLIGSTGDVNTSCCDCKKIIPMNEYFFIHKSWSKKQFVKEYYCENCIKEHKKRIYDEFITCLIASEVPANSILIPDFPPLLQSSTNIYDAAISNRGIKSDTSSTIITDHTKLAGKESFEGAKIGKGMNEEIEKLDKPIESEKEAICLLQDLRKSKPLENNLLSLKKDGGT